MKHIIQAKNLSKTFKTKQKNSFVASIFRPSYTYFDAVGGISFDITKGESVAFLGPNGAGKTTTTKMLTGLVKPSAGQITTLGFNPFSKNPQFLKQIGLVMGNKAGLNWDLTATQSFELLQKIYAIDETVASKRVASLAAILNVEHVLNKQVRKLSLGERMKLELIGAILHDPEILFLDEPTIGLDIDSKKNIRSFLKSLHESGKTLLLTSHDMDDIATVCQRAIIINHGQIIFDGNMDKLKSKYSDSRYLNLTFTKSSPPKAGLAVYGEVILLTPQKLTMKVQRDKVMDVASAISKKYPIHDITIEQVALEEIISDLFQ